MKNWKYDLFNFKQSLTLEQLEISSVIDRHLQVFDRFSEKELTYSIKESLNGFNFDDDVKRLVEDLDAEIENDSLVYALKDLYKKIERGDRGLLYREPLSKILDLINKDTDAERMEGILSDLALYDWIPEIKAFVHELTADKSGANTNTTSGSSKSSKVCTVIEEVDGGYVAYVGNRWFLFAGDAVSEASLSDYFSGEELSVLYNLEKALNMSCVEDDKFEFCVDDNLCLTITGSGKVFINDEQVDKQTSIEDLFNSPIIPVMKKSYYSVVKTLIDNLDKVVDLDVATKITNISKPLTELYVFNYKDKLYLYSVDKRTGNSFYEYDSVNQLIDDVQRELGFDISKFVENKLTKEMKQYKKLEYKEQEIQGKIKEVQESIEALESEKELLLENTELRTAFDSLISYKEELVNNLRRVQNAKVAERKRLA